MANKKDAKNLSENCQGSVCKTHRPPICVFLCTQRPNSRLMIKQSAAHTQSKKRLLAFLKSLFKRLIGQQFISHPFTDFICKYGFFKKHSLQILSASLVIKEPTHFY